MAKHHHQTDVELNLRRLRLNPLTRELAASVRLSHTQFIQPYFVVDGIKKKEEIPGLTGVYRETKDSLLKQIESDLLNGCNKILLFGVPSKKSATSFDFNFTAKQIANIRKEFGNDVWISVDICLCSYTNHGQCGILTHEGDHVINHSTVDVLAEQALYYAQAGADCVAPSDMMDGRIGAIREILDHKGLYETLIMSYAAKFHSKFYGPFRVAADSAPKGKIVLKDRATYQIDPANPRDALNSAMRDASEGADILMVKPGLPYLDVLQTLSQNISKPWAVYEVSGEYAAVELLAEKGLMNREAAHKEAWIAFARAGAQMIISYGARSAKQILSA